MLTPLKKGFNLNFLKRKVHGAHRNGNAFVTI